MSEIAASKLSYDSIREYAARVGDQHQVYNNAGRADIDGLVKSLGGTISYGHREALVVYAPNEFEISLPELTSARRDRFTTAHELGHYFLHYRLPRLSGRREFGRGKRNTLETQANVFASALLMPEEHFRVAFADCQGDDWKLSRIFDVSPDAAAVRSQVLGLRPDSAFAMA